MRLRSLCIYHKNGIYFA